MVKKHVLFKKCFEYFITFVCIITLNFFIPRLMPGDPFTFLSSEEGDVTAVYSQDDIERYQAYYGLDEPMMVQYGNYIRDLGEGYLGYSIYFNEEVVTIILNRIAWTLLLVLASVLLSSVMGTILGCISAWNRNKWFDKLMYLLMVTISEIPSFLVGIILLFFIGAKLKWFPLSGGKTHFVIYPTLWDQIVDLLRHAALPVAALVLTRLGGFYLLARNSMISVLSKDYIKTARGKGLKKRHLIFKHALRNAMLPIITRIFLSFGSFFGGAILVENVFHYPGMGQLMRQAVMVRDYPLIQGIFLLVTFTVLGMNFLADVLYKKLDPRVM